MSDDFLTSLGLSLKDMVAGFAGGIANTFIFKKSNPWEIIGSIIVGGIAANYLGAPISKMLEAAIPVLKVLGNTVGFSDFVVGLTGMAICQSIIESVSGWKPFKRLKND